METKKQDKYKDGLCYSSISLLLSVFFIFVFCCIAIQDKPGLWSYALIPLLILVVAFVTSLVFLVVFLVLLLEKET